MKPPERELSATNARHSREKSSTTVLGRFSRCDVVPFDARLLAPPEDGHRG
jgi:hypothetical protein